jgi:hypothetical protein
MPIGGSPMQRRLVFAGLIAALSLINAPAQAADCMRGSLHGSTGTSGPPDENIQCKVMGRIFCALSDYREDDIPADPAVARIAEWLSHLGQTGSHIGGNYRPAVKAAAGYVYSHDQMLPWTAYNYAVWTCGVDQRVVDPEAKKNIAKPWEQAAQQCLKQFPGQGDGSANEKLKRCLNTAMESLVKQSQQLVKK